jgi:hypothetical protein
MSLAPCRPYSTPACSGTMGEQQIQFGTHLLLLRVENAADAYLLAAIPTPTEIPGHEKRQPQKHATSITDCLPRPPVIPGGRLIWSLASTPISVRPGSGPASGVHDCPIAGADQSVIGRAIATSPPAVERERGAWKAGMKPVTNKVTHASVAETAARLIAEVDARGIRQFTTNDHSAEARAVGLELRDAAVGLREPVCRHADHAGRVVGG